MNKFNVEFTDTFNGDANYSWVNRKEITVKEDASQSQIMRAAKRAVCITGCKGVTESYCDGYTFKPYNQCTILFVNYMEQSI
tara:strand:+ start:514 stop:759 length:246 start_codon:yes stop_codon:yes gene_type:complete